MLKFGIFCLGFSANRVELGVIFEETKRKIKKKEENEERQEDSASDRRRRCSSGRPERPGMCQPSPLEEEWHLLEKFCIPGTRHTTAAAVLLSLLMSLV